MTTIESIDWPTDRPNEQLTQQPIKGLKHRLIECMLMTTITKLLLTLLCFWFFCCYDDDWHTTALVKFVFIFYHCPHKHSMLHLLFLSFFGFYTSFTHTHTHLRSLYVRHASERVVDVVVHACVHACHIFVYLAAGRQVAYSGVINLQLLRHHHHHHHHHLLLLLRYTTTTDQRVLARVCIHICSTSSCCCNRQMNDDHSSSSYYKLFIIV